MPRTLIEVCVSSVADAIAAVKAGADRLELCSALEVGGLTPSAALLESVLESVSIPVVVMIRPRPGGFHYAPDEFRVAMLDAKWALNLGAAGIVFGFLDVNGSIDSARCREFVDLAGSHDTVFHRAFDFVRDPIEAVDQLAGLRLTRLLTSGKQASAIEGADLIRSLVVRTAGTPAILPGGGIQSENIREIIRLTGCDQVHIGAAQTARDNSLLGNCKIDLVASHHLANSGHRKLDAERLGKIIQIVKQ